MNTLDKFVPPGKKPPIPEWATYIPDRTPAFKIHKQRSHARNAVGNRESILYQYINDQWVEILRNEPSKGPRNCDKCGIAVAKWYGVYGQQKWQGDKLLTVCPYGCKKTP